MKTIGKILVISGIAGAVAYLISKRHYSGELREQEQKEKKSDTESKVTDKAKTKKAPSSTNTEDDDEQRMFKNLKMTDEQRKRYEADYQVLNNTWLKKNPNKPLSNIELREQQDQTMKAVLDEAQYSAYREWFADQNQV